MLSRGGVYETMKLATAVDEFIKGYFAARRRAAHTVKAYSSDLAQFAEFAGARSSLSSLRFDLVGRWVERLRASEYSDTSIRRKTAALRLFCSYWVRKGELAESPFWRLELRLESPGTEPETLGRRDVVAIIERARRVRAEADGEVKARRARGGRGSRGPTRFQALRDLALVELLFATGMKPGEVVSLDVGDFVAGESLFKVQGSGGRERLAFVLDEAAARAQVEYLAARSGVEAESGALFLNFAGGRMTTQTVLNVLARLCREARVGRRVTPSLIRHTVERTLLEKNVDQRVVLEFLGKTSLAGGRRRPRVSREHMVGELRKTYAAA